MTMAARLCQRQGDEASFWRSVTLTQRHSDASGRCIVLTSTVPQSYARHPKHALAVTKQRQTVAQCGWYSTLVLQLANTAVHTAKQDAVALVPRTKIKRAVRDIRYDYIKC